MPYNNTPIAPPQEFTGAVSLPLARVKKIIQADDDINACSNAAAFAITVATEMFIQHLANQSHNIVKGEKKQRRNIAYRDVAAAVAKHENLEFIDDVVPRTTTYRAVKERRAHADAAPGGGVPAPGGQRTLDHMHRRDGSDAHMADAPDEGERGKYDPARDATEPASPASARAGARLGYDAVRNGFDAVRAEVHVPMEED